MEFKDNIVIVTNKNGVIKDDIEYIREVLQETMGKTYNYVMFKDPLGYYHAYDHLLNKFIYCTTLNKTRAIKYVSDYVKEQEK